MLKKNENYSLSPLPDLHRNFHCLPVFLRVSDSRYTKANPWYNNGYVETVCTPSLRLLIVNTVPGRWDAQPFRQDRD